MNKSPQVKFLFETVQLYKHIVLFVIILSIVGSGFDAVSVGMMVPLLSSLQSTEKTSSLPHLFGWWVHFLKPYSAEQQILFSLGLITLATLLKNILIALSIRLGHWLSARLVADMRNRAMSLLMNVGIEFHYHSRTGDLIDETINNTYYVEFLMRTMIELVANAVTLTVLVVMLFVLSWQLSLLALLLAGGFQFYVTFYSRDLLALGHETANRDRELISTLHESLLGIGVIKATSQEKRQSRTLQQHVEAARDSTFHSNFRMYVIHPIVDMWATISFAILFVVAMFMYQLNVQLMLTQFFPFLLVLLRCSLLGKLIQAQKSSIVGRWPYVVLFHKLLQTDGKPFIPDGGKNFPGLQREIRMRNVDFSYRGRESLALSGVNCVFPAGKVTAIIGESGCGKSTIGSLLLRLYDPQGGEILIDDEPLSGYRLESFHQRVGVVSQDTFLFNNTVKFNITFNQQMPCSQEQIVDAAQKAGAHEFIMGLPLGYDTIIGDRGAQLSGGQRQRLSIVRAILRDPEILLLDEATSSLDASTEAHIHESIREISRGRTVIIITHRLSTIENADQIIRLDEGRIAEIKAPNSC